MQDIDIAEFLASLGYEGEAGSAARQVLIAAGITHARKTRMAVNKLPLAEAELSRRFFRACTGQPCQAQAAAQARGRQVVTVPKESCEVCGGSENARAAREMAKAMAAAGKTRLLVVGGTPNMATELARLLPPACQVRFVLDGTRKAAKDALQDAGWADFIVIWASTPIAHKTTELYKAYKPLTVSRRGISALAAEVTLSLAGGR